MSRLRFACALILSFALAAAACSGSDDPDDAANPTSTTATTAPPVTEPESDAEETESTENDTPDESVAPTSPAEAIDLVLELINGRSIDDAEFRVLFAPVFVQAIGFEDFDQIVTDAQAESPWVLEEELGSSAVDGGYLVRSEMTDEALIVSVSVDSAGAGINGLFFAPDREFEVPSSPAEAVERLQALGTVRLAVADASNDSCAPVLDEGAIETMPIGSIFKLYVLGAVVEAVDAGDVTWDAEVTIDDALDSLPSGSTQNDEPGTTRTVRDLAEVMIAESDNTATDHLIDLVGREAVEAVLVPMGNDAIEQNTPFLTTRELFILKYGDSELGRTYVDADAAARRAILEDQVAIAELPDVASVDQTSPVLVEELEWFASPVALCDAMTFLVSDPVALEILTANPGVPDEAGQWDHVAFKGGSEPGLLAAAWWTSDGEGRAYVTAASVVADGILDEFEAISLMAYLRDQAPTEG